MPYMRKKTQQTDRQIFKLPMGFPGFQGPQGFPGPSGPQGQNVGAPVTPPPNITPSESKATALNSNMGGNPSVKAIDAGAIFPCRYRFAYIWLNNGRSFWVFITYVGRTSMSGWRWNGRRWVYFGTDLRRVRSFICY